MNRVVKEKNSDSEKKKGEFFSNIYMYVNMTENNNLHLQNISSLYSFNILILTPCINKSKKVNKTKIINKANNIFFKRRDLLQL